MQDVSARHGIGAAKVLAFPKPHTPRDKAYLAFIRTFACIDCGWPAHLGMEAHHIFTGGGSIKCSDYDTVPLCPPSGRGCHRKADKSKEVGEGYKDKVRKYNTIWLERGNKFKE